MKLQYNHESTEHTELQKNMMTEEIISFLDSATEWNEFREPGFDPNTDQPLDYSSEATAFAIPMFEALHQLAENPETNLRNPNPEARPLASVDKTLAECLKQFGALCYTLHNLAEKAIPNLEPDYHPHQTVVANSDLLRELACLALQIEPYFSEPEDLEAVAQPLMPNRLPAILPIKATDFQN